MAYPYSFIKLTFGGDLRDTDEVWACGFHIGRESANTTQNDLENIGSIQLQVIWDAIANFHSNGANDVPTNMRLQWVKMAAVGTNGKYLGAPVEHIYSTARSGSNTKGFIPSTAVVYTLVADKFKDPGKYNRFYLPTTPPTASNGHKLTSAETEDRATSLANIVNDINAALAVEFSGLRVRIVSQKTNIYRQVSSVRVGDIIDVQRRRRNALRESYNEHAVTTI